MGIVRWAKKHPWEAAALAAAAVATGGMALAPEAAAVGAAGAAGAAGAGEAAAAAAAAEAAAAGSPALLGAGAGGASLGAEAAAAGGAGMGSSALLAAMPLGEDFAAQMAGQSMAAGAGGFDPALAGQFVGQGAEASLYDPAQLANPQTAMGPRESTWLSRMNPKNVMSLGMMAAQLGAPRQQGGPAPVDYGHQASAQMTQEQITKKWLLQNDPNTYRRIYGDPQGVA